MVQAERRAGACSRYVEAQPIAAVRPGLPREYQARRVNKTTRTTRTMFLNS